MPCLALQWSRKSAHPHYFTLFSHFLSPALSQVTQVGPGTTQNLNWIQSGRVWPGGEEARQYLFFLNSLIAWKASIQHRINGRINPSLEITGYRAGYNVSDTMHLHNQYSGIWNQPKKIPHSIFLWNRSFSCFSMRSIYIENLEPTENTNHVDQDHDDWDEHCETLCEGQCDDNMESNAAEIQN